MQVNIVNKSDFELPQYAIEGSAGMDLKADLKRYWAERLQNHSDPLVIYPYEVYKIPTGIFISLPKIKYPEASMTRLLCDLDQEYEAQIRPRSGLAAKHGITILNTPGTIDQSYTGEICILLIKLTNGPYTINHGDRIAQMIFNRVEKVTWNQVDQLDETQRGDGGFGHTGK